MIFWNFFRDRLKNLVQFVWKFFPFSHLGESFFPLEKSLFASYMVPIEVSYVPCDKVLCIPLQSRVESATVMSATVMWATVSS